MYLAVPITEFGDLGGMVAERAVRTEFDIETRHRYANRRALLVCNIVKTGAKGYSENLFNF